MIKQTDQKISKTDVSTNCIWITLCFLIVIFYQYLNHILYDFSYPKSGSGSGGHTPTLFLLPYLFSGLILIPYVAGTKAWVKFSKKMEANSEPHQVLIVRAFSILVYASVILFVWLYRSEGFIAAFGFQIQNPPILKLAIFSYFFYFFGKIAFENSPRAPNSIVTWTIYTFSGLHILSLYSFFGVDDGCRAVGGDPLFGGAEYYECDEDYVSKQDFVKQVSHENQFNSNAFFAAEMVLNIICCSVMITFSYWVNKSYIQSNPFFMWGYSKNTYMRIIHKIWWPFVLLLAIIMLIYFVS